jgi:hypothetical protein
MQGSQKLTAESGSYFQQLINASPERVTSRLQDYWRNSSPYHYLQLAKIIFILKIEYRLLRVVFYKRK